MRDWLKSDRGVALFFLGLSILALGLGWVATKMKSKAGLEINLRR